jgi:hypothetical protein
MVLNVSPFRVLRAEPQSLVRPRVDCQVFEARVFVEWLQIWILFHSLPRIRWKPMIDRLLQQPESFVPAASMGRNAREVVPRNGCLGIIRLNTRS